MKIIFVRHGKDDSNYRGGWSTMDLTEEGKIQAMRLAEFCILRKGLLIYLKLCQVTCQEQYQLQKQYHIN